MLLRQVPKHNYEEKFRMNAVLCYCPERFATFINFHLPVCNHKVNQPRIGKMLLVFVILFETLLKEIQ